ncbi:MAG: hypothetical protein J6X18_01180 [Bacteroidales bacterium]|nr:hypothetical protein [Bacteroidales bacterium]
MNREKIGSMIVDEIISAYKNSEDFEKDAVEYVKKTILYELNAINSQAGCEFFSFMKGSDRIKVVKELKKTDERSQKLIETLEKTKRLKETVEELFQLTFGEGEHMRP